MEFSWVSFSRRGLSTYGVLGFVVGAGYVEMEEIVCFGGVYVVVIVAIEASRFYVSIV